MSVRATSPHTNHFLLTTSTKSSKAPLLNTRMCVLRACPHRTRTHTHKTYPHPPHILIPCLCAPHIRIPTIPAHKHQALSPHSKYMHLCCARKPDQCPFCSRHISAYQPCLLTSANRQLGPTSYIDVWVLRARARTGGTHTRKKENHTTDIQTNSLSVRATSRHTTHSCSQALSVCPTQKPCPRAPQRSCLRSSP